MNDVSYLGHRFHPNIIEQAVWLYFRFTMSFRNVEDLLAERGIDVTYETVRRWVLKFGQAYARGILRRRNRPDGCWHLDEDFVKIGDQQLHPWRAVDGEGELLDVLVQKSGASLAGLFGIRRRRRNKRWPGP